MKWIKADVRLPSDQQEVLIKVNGQVSLARFDAEAGNFKLRNGTTLPAEGSKAEWMELIAPYKQ